LTAARPGPSLTRLLETFRGKNAFVTGGSSGIGRATARLLVEAGARVAICGRDEPRLARACSEIAPHARFGGSVSAIVLDVRDGAGVVAAADSVVRQIGSLDLLINNAGVARPGYFEELPDHVFEDAIETNYLGPVRVTRAFLSALRARPGAHVSFVSSVAGFLGVFGYTAYAASKFALTGFADTLRQELKPMGIGVSILFPPDTETAQLASEEPFKPAETRAVSGNVRAVSPEFVARALLEGIAAGRFHILPGLETKSLYWLQRHAPWIVRWHINRCIRGSARERVASLA
jgi:3-dehydrosphinganine reductase